MQTLPTPKQFSPQTLPLKIVALGDSLVYGYGDPEGGGWVERLRRQWLSPDSAGHVLYNLGIRGNGVAEVGQRLEQEWSLRGELRNRQPDLIILSVGVNDSAHLSKPDGRLFTPFDQFQLRMSDLLERSQKLSPVFFVGMIPIDEAKMPFLNCFYYCHESQYRYKEFTRLACEFRDIPYLDIFDLWMQRGETWRKSRLCEDGLHPNILGYKSLLEDITSWQSLQPILF